jgi:large subunit ribosomal protein L12e
MYVCTLVKHSGNIPLKEIIEIAKKMRPKSMARELKGTVREILGTAFSVGCTVDGSSPQDISEKVASGVKCFIIFSFFPDYSDT